MPKTKGPRAAPKQKLQTSTTSSATELEDITEVVVVENPLEDSKVKTCLEKFEMEFAFRLERFDKLLEEKLFALKQAKEKLKIKHSDLLSSTLEANKVMDIIHDKENVNITEAQRSSHKKAVKTENVTSLQGPNGKQLSRKSKQKNKEQTLVPYTGNAFKTPAISTGFPSLPTVTPKVAMNTPISMLRLPRQGEMALSMSGSPVMVTAMSHESKPNINIPLNNEQILTLIPHERLDPNSVPELDDEAVKQLQALNRNLMAFINITSSNSELE